MLLFALGLLFGAGIMSYFYLSERDKRKKLYVEYMDALKHSHDGKPLVLESYVEYYPGEEYIEMQLNRRLLDILKRHDAIEYTSQKKDILGQKSFDGDVYVASARIKVFLPLYKTAD